MGHTLVKFTDSKPTLVCPLFSLWPPRFFCPSSEGWPPFMRIDPILDVQRCVDLPEELRPAVLRAVQQGLHVPRLPIQHTAQQVSAGAEGLKKSGEGKWLKPVL